MQFEVIKEILDINKYNLKELRIWDFRVFEIVVNIALNTFNKLKYLDMKNVQIETPQEKQVLEQFLRQLKETKTLTKMSINKVFSKSQDYSNRYLETIAKLRLNKIIVYNEEDCGIGN